MMNLILLPRAETAFNRNDLARRYARRHAENDAGVVRVFHLPTGAPSREIRLLEVNDLIAETTPLEPIDFGVDRGGEGAHTLYVLDVTPRQWDALLAGDVALPVGWTLQGRQDLGGRDA